MAKEKQAQAEKTEQAKLVDRIQKAAESVQDMIKDYNEKYVAKTVEKGKGTFKQYNDKYLNPWVEKGKAYVDTPYKKITDSVDELVKKGRSIEKDARKRVDGYVANGRKYISGLPVVETLEKRVNAGFQQVPAMINLPGKTDIEKLTQAMEALNTKLESLNKQVRA